MATVEWTMKDGRWEARISGLLVGLTHWAPTTGSWWVDLETGNYEGLVVSDSMPSLDEAQAVIERHAESDRWPFRNMAAGRELDLGWDTVGTMHD